MKKVIVFNGQFAPKLGGQFELEWGGQFAPKLVVNLHWKVVVNLTGFSTPDESVVDEFTSVIDRQIAKIGAMAFAKNWRKNKGKKVVLLSCHYDIIEWLQPDWVYDVNTKVLKKKLKSSKGQTSSLIFGRSTEVIGSALKSITI